MGNVLILNMLFLAQQDAFRPLGRLLVGGFGLVCVMVGILSILLLIAALTMRSRLNKIASKLDDISRERERPGTS